MHRSLSVWLGTSGSHALFTRALTQARVAHPPLRDIALRATPHSKLLGVTESVQAHGERGVAAGLEAVLDAVLDVLGRLVGHDLAARLLDQDVPNNAGEDEVAR